MRKTLNFLLVVIVLLFYQKAFGSMKNIAIEMSYVLGAAYPKEFSIWGGAKLIVRLRSQEFSRDQVKRIASQVLAQEFLNPQRVNLETFSSILDFKPSLTEPEQYQIIEEELIPETNRVISLLEKALSEITPTHHISITRDDHQEVHFLLAGKFQRSLVQKIINQLCEKIGSKNITAVERRVLYVLDTAPIRIPDTHFPFANTWINPFFTSETVWAAQRIWDSDCSIYKDKTLCNMFPGNHSDPYMIFGNDQKQFGRVIPMLNHAELRFLRHIRKLASDNHFRSRIPILEIGPAHGDLMLKAVLAHAHVDAIKISSGAVKIAHEKLARLLPPFLLGSESISDVYKLREENFLDADDAAHENQYQLVFSGNNVHFLTPHQLKIYLKKIKRYLKPGGKVILSSIATYGEHAKFIEKTSREFWKQNNFQGYISDVEIVNSDTSEVASLILSLPENYDSQPNQLTPGLPKIGSSKLPELPSPEKWVPQHKTYLFLDPHTLKNLFSLFGFRNIKLYYYQRNSLSDQSYSVDEITLAYLSEQTKENYVLVIEAEKGAEESSLSEFFWNIWGTYVAENL